MIVNEFVARRVQQRILAGDYEEVFTQLSEEIDMARDLSPAEKKAADDAAERGRKANAEMAERVRKEQEKANQEARKNWS